MLQNYDEAIRLLHTCLGIDATNAAVHYMLGGLYLEKKQLPDAELYSRKALALDKENAWYKVQLANVLKEEHNYEEAAKLFLEAGEQQKDINNMLESVYLYLMAKNYNKALGILNRLEKEGGISEEIIRQKEQIYLAQNKVDKAIQEVKKLIAEFPKESKYRGMLADLYMANNMPGEAVTIYSELLHEDPHNGYAAFALSDYYKVKGDKEKYFTYLKQGLLSEQVEVKTKLTMIVAFIGAKEFPDHRDRCVDLAKAFIFADPNEATAYMVLADLYVSLDKDFAGAREEYLHATRLDPASFPAWQQLVLCDVELKNFKNLQEDCDRALEYFPNESLFHVYSTIASMQLRDHEKAIASAKRGIEVSIGLPEVMVQLLSNLGDANYALKRYAASDSAYEEALKLDPKNTYALNNYAYYLSLRKERLDKAEEMSRKTIEAEPENASYLDTYGWILYQRKEYEKAKEYIERSLKLSPENGEVLEHLGDILYRLNEKSAALEKWKEAKKLGSDGEHLDKKIKEGKLYE
jgi:tetratricopeptide (TPR) repeat protein